jgi:alkylmercury lyase
MISNGTPSPERFWEAFAGELPTFSHDDQRIALGIYRALARGRPLSAEQLAVTLSLPESRMREALARDSIRCFTYVDEQGRVAGFGGLATTPMHHRFQLNGRTLWTWCAWDSLFIPELLGETARVESPDPETSEVVRLTLSPEHVDLVQPADAVVSFLLPKPHDIDTSATNVMASFCHFVFFFASRESGERWAARHPRTFLYSVEEAFQLGRRLNRQIFGHALARGHGARDPGTRGRAVAADPER